MGVVPVPRERHAGRVQVVHGDAADLVAILADHDADRVDAVVSGLPWVAYRGPLVRDLADVLAPTGVFSQFAYSWSRWAPDARAELAALQRHFADVVVSSTIWRNLPPAVVYYARAPIGSAPTRDVRTPRGDPRGRR